MTEKSALPEATERSLQILKKQIPAWGEYLLAQRGLSMRTVVSYRQDLENFFLFLDELDAGDKTSLDEHDLFLYLAWLRARKNAGCTLARRLSALRGFFEYTVEEGLLAAQVGSGEVRVLATPMMIMGMERAAMEAVRPCLPEGMTSVGTRVDISHMAPTPCGMKVRFEAKLTAVSANGRGLTFAVAAYDEAGPIGEGTHERVVVDREKFQSRAQTRATQG